MVIADINIFCEKQSKSSEISIFNSQMDIYLMKMSSEDYIYNEDYTWLQKKEGIWYQIYPTARNCGDYSQEYLELSEDESYNVFFTNKTIKNDVNNFLKRLFNEQDIDRIYFFIHLEGYNEQSVTLKRDEFLELYKNDCLISNVVYIIER